MAIKLQSFRWNRYFALVFFIFVAFSISYYLYCKKQEELQSRFLFHLLTSAAQSISETMDEVHISATRAVTGIETASENNVSDINNIIRLKLDLNPYMDINSLIIQEAKPNLESKVKKDALTSGAASTSLYVDAEKKDCFLMFTLLPRSAPNEDNAYKTYKIRVKFREIFESSLPDDFYSIFDGGIVLARGNNKEVLQKASSVVRVMQFPMGNTSQGNSDPNSSQQNLLNTQIRDVQITGRKYKLFLQPFHMPIKVAENSSSDDPTKYPIESDWILGGFIPTSAFWARIMAVRADHLVIFAFFLIVALLAVPFVRIRFIGLREKLKAQDVYVLLISLVVGCSLIVLALVCYLTYRTEIAAQDIKLEAIARNIIDKFYAESRALEDELDHQTKQADQDSRANPKEVATPPTNMPDRELKDNILDSAEINVEYPLFEMVFGMDQHGEQKWKWSTRKTTTTMLNVAERKYFVYARDLTPPFYSFSVNPRHPGGEEHIRGRYIESTRSLNTGDLFAILSLRLPTTDADASISTAIQAKLLSLIDPVLPPEYSFAVFDQNGIVQFHSYKGFILRENFFDEIDQVEEMKTLVFAGTADSVNITYKAIPQRAWVTPFVGTPWTLIVLTENRIWGYINLESLTFSMAFYGLLLFLELLSFGLIHCHVGRKTNAGEIRRMWFWPDKARVKNYHTLIFGMIRLALIWLIITAFAPTYVIVFWNIIYPLVLIWAFYCILCRRLPESDEKTKTTSPRALKWVYIALIAGLLFSVAILPPFAFYRALHEEIIIVFVKQRQLAMAQTLRKRIENHVKEYRRVNLNESNRKLIERMLLLSDGNKSIEAAPDVHTENPLAIIADGNPNPKKAAVRVSITECIDEDNDPNDERAQKLAAIGLKLDTTQVYCREVKDIQPVQGKKSEQKLVALLSKLSLFPSYDGALSATRTLSTAKIVDSNVRFTTEYPNHLTMTYRNFRPSVILGKAFETGTYTSPASRRPIHLIITMAMDNAPPYYALWLFLFFIIGGALLLWMIEATMRVVFISDLKFPQSLRGDDFGKGTNPSKQIFIRIDEKDPEPSLDSFTIGAKEIRDASTIHDLIFRVRTSTNTKVVLPYFDCGLDELEIAQKKLELLEGLVKLGDIRIIIKTDIDPLYYLTSRAHDFWQERGENRIPLSRWATVLQDFEKRRYEANENEFAILRGNFNKELCLIANFNALKEELKKSLVDEGWPDRCLQEHAKKLASREELREYSAADVVDQVRDLADAHYRRIWSSCSTDEKMLLFMLAQEGLINWQMKDTVRHLIRRRIVIVDPNFRFMNESFRQFALRAERPEVFQEWEEAVGESTWSRLKVPLFISATALGGFLFITQKEMFTTTIGLLTALTAGAPVLFRFFGAFARNEKVSSTQE